MGFAWNMQSRGNTCLEGDYPVKTEKDIENLKRIMCPPVMKP